VHGLAEGAAQHAYKTQIWSAVQVTFHAWIIGRISYADAGDTGAQTRISGVFFAHDKSRTAPFISWSW